MATTPYTGFTSSTEPATVTTTAAPTFQVPSVVSPSPVNTNATFDQIATVTQPVPSFTQTTPVINPAITTGIVNRTNEQIVADQQAALTNSVEQQNQNTLSGEIQKYLGLSGTPGFNEQKATEQAALMQSNDVVGKAAAVKSIIDKINANKVLAQIGGTATNVGGLTQSQYTADIESKNLLLGAQLLVAQGQYDSARDAVTQAIDMKYAPQEARYNALLKYYDVNAKALGDKGAQMKELTTAKLADIADKKAKDEAINQMLIKASEVAPPDVLKAARDVQARGGNQLEVATVLGKYGGDYYKRVLLEEQIKTEKAQRANIASQIAERNAKVVLPTTIDGVIATLPKSSQDRYYKLQSDFDAATKTYRGAIDAAGSVKALSKDATAQDQTAIIFQYMKTLDPTSTVREGEFALVASTAGLGDRAVNAIKKLDNGQRLNETQIKDIVGAVDKLASNSKLNLEATSKEYDRRAAKFGLPTGLFYEKQNAQPEKPAVSESGTSLRAKLEAANPALKKQPFEGTSIIKAINNGKLDFNIPNN